MKRLMSLAPLIGVVVLLALSARCRADNPDPAKYPTSWELTFTHDAPKRIVVKTPGEAIPNAYWYMTYHVVNNTSKDSILFYPRFEMQNEKGKVFRSDFDLPTAVFDAIKDAEGNKYLQSAQDVGGDLRQGEDQSRDGVAIWPEPDLRMGTFTIYARGFWGETATVTVGDKTVVLHKTLQLMYHVDSDETHPGEGSIVEKLSKFIMR